MKNFKNRFNRIMLGLSIILGLAPKAYANTGGLFLEPALTYEIGETSTDYPAPLSDSTGKAVGLGIGARLGFHINDALFLALDLRYSMPDFEDSSVNYSAKATSSNWGPVLGIQTPIAGLRIWGSYIMSGELNPDASNGTDMKFTEARGYRIGTGIKATAVSFNLEYEVLKYEKAELEQSAAFPPGTTFDNTDLEKKAWLVSVSFPIGF